MRERYTLKGRERGWVFISRGLREGEKEIRRRREIKEEKEIVIRRVRVFGWRREV